MEHAQPQPGTASQDRGFSPYGIPHYRGTIPLRAVAFSRLRASVKMAYWSTTSEKPQQSLVS